MQSLIFNASPRGQGTWAGRLSCASHNERALGVPIPTPDCIQESVSLRVMTWPPCGRCWRLWAGHLLRSKALLGCTLGPESKADGGALLQDAAAAQPPHLLAAVQHLHAPLPSPERPLQKTCDPPAHARSMTSSLRCPSQVKFLLVDPVMRALRGILSGHTVVCSQKQ